METQVFLKSGSFDRGQYTSCTARFTNVSSAKKGANTMPCGGAVRPAVDTWMSKHQVAVLHPQLLAIGRIHIQQRLGKGAVQLGHAAGHGASVPVLQ